MKIRSYRKCLTGILLCLLLMGCTTEQAKEPIETGEKQIQIVTTIFPPYDFSREVAGAYAEVTQLLPPGAESHTFEPTPQDILKIQNCDLFIYAGGESDTWLENIMESIDTEQVQFISMLDCVTAVEEEVVAGMQSNEEEGEETEYDEHVWTSPKNAVLITQRIEGALEQLDAEHQEDYQKNAKAYIEKLTLLDEKYQNMVNTSAGNTIVVGDRFPFRYLAEEYGIEYFAAFPGCSEDAEPSAATLAFLIDKVREEKLPVVFHIEFSNEKIADSICESTGAKKLLLHSCHNVAKDEMDHVTYLDLMEQNLKHLQEALN